ncbi:hypothetical protein EDD85DRAFT_782997 [Armillaria nabsnona]|nr:hypothetical protein EDD85DRAFT_782997 [Armillaria nabsnona]
MADTYYLLCAILTKAPALWDAEVYDSLSNWQITEQIEGAHTLLTTYRNAFNRPYPDFIERFFVTTSRAVHKLPDRLVNGHWQVWVYGPDLVKEFLKPPPMKKRKTHELSSPPMASQARTLSVKPEKPACKCSKPATVPSTATSKDGPSSVLSKKLSTKDKLKAEIQLAKKESSTTPTKTPAKP